MNGPEPREPGSVFRMSAIHAQGTTGAGPDAIQVPARFLSDETRRQEAGDDLAGKAFPIFAFLWAIATLFHQLAFPARHTGFFFYALTMAALVVLMRPSSVPRFIALALAQVAQVLYYLPEDITNHWIFTFFINLTVLLAFAVLAVRYRTPMVARGELFRTFAPAARVELLILYFYVTLHKLNADFLNPATSCAVDHYMKIARQYWFLPTVNWLQPLMIYGTLLIEGGIPLLLLFRRTRVAGVLLGLAFHFVLAINPQHRFYNFSAMVFALFFLFLPYDYVPSLQKLCARFATGRWLLAGAEAGALQRALRRGVLAVSAVLLFFYLLRFDPADHTWLVGGIVLSNRMLWMVYGGTLMATFLIALRNGNVLAETRPLDSFALRPAVLAVVPLLVVLNGMSPYLGLKTETSFAMFSNLRTEGGVNNHLFLPRLPLAGYQDDLVQLESSTLTAFRRMAEEGRELPYAEFRRRAARHHNQSVVYVHNGIRREVPRIGDDPELAHHLPVLERKLLHFRPVDTSPLGVRCSH